MNDKLLRPEFRNLHNLERKRISMPSNVTMRLSRLEKPEPWQQSIQEKFLAVFKEVQVQQYPDYNAFYNRLSDYTEVPQKNIVVGAGIEEFIRTLMFLCAAPGECVAYTWPTCAMFDIYTAAFSLEPTRLVQTPDNIMDVYTLEKKLPKDLRLLILPNPGQPVDVHYQWKDVGYLAEACKLRGAVLAIDEAYNGFGPSSSQHLAFDYDNVVVLRTFSKVYGAAGIRLGYAIAGDRLAGALHAVRQSGEVSSLSMALATVLMDNNAYVYSSAIEIIRARDALRDKLLSIGFRAWGSNANHVLVELKSTEQRDNVRAALLERGVLVKADYEYPLNRHMLITCGSQQLMGAFYDEFIQALV